MRLESTIAYQAHSGLTIYSEAIHDTKYSGEIVEFLRLGVIGMGLGVNVGVGRKPW